jgi:hypothetical protein
MKYYSDYQIKKNKMDWTCDTYGRKRRYLRGFWWAYVKERSNLEYLSLNGRIILKCILKTWDGDVDWNDLAQNSVRWWSLVNAVMNFRFP